MRFKKLRLWASYPFAGLYLFFAWNYGMSFKFGLWLVLAGLFVRFWAAGYIKKISSLATCGPYAYVRNPLYLGNFLMGLGFCLFVNNIFISIIYSAVFFFFYQGTIKKEEILLTELFGREYLKYKKAVPVIFPNFKKYKSKTAAEFSIKQAHYNGEFIRVLVTGALLCALYLFRYFLKERILNKQEIIIAAALIMMQLGLLFFTVGHRKDYIRKVNKK
ncbi:MAG: isoprenylcysteine carboxylmethyltransferase family protein [Candidatus Omnitrophica bacterium]|nr:isoprenylcysteine carboxylmethyltransferase family protein [Candidatus Omnitrophota bacterium]